MFYITDGAELYIYNKDKTMIQGPYTSDLYSGIQSIGSDLMAGDEIILEYIEPSSAEGKSILHISKVVHGYKKLLKSLLGYGESGLCNININCPEGDDWQDQSDAVAVIIVDDEYHCSGSLLNNTCQNYTPYFLSAFHCADDGDGSLSSGEIDDVEDWVFRFQFKSPTCTNSTPSGWITYNKCTYRAGYDPSDFILVELDNTPTQSTGIKNLGWSRYTNPDSAVCIHHPLGDVMKISYDSDAPTNTDYSSSTGSGHWRVVWDGGTTEYGSSGSPLFNENQRVIGQLHGGWASCALQDSADWFGAFDYSWGREANNNPIQGRSHSNSLYYWLDPNDVGNMTTNTISIPYITGPDMVCYSPSQTFSLHDRPSGTNVNWTYNTSLLYPVSGQGTNNFTVRAKTQYVGGEGWVQANISTGNCDPVSFRRSGFWVGVPDPTIDGNIYPECFMREWYFLEPEDKWGTYYWHTDYKLRIIGYQYGYKALVEPLEGGTGQIFCDVTNTCGTGYGRLVVYISCRGFKMSPNPADDYVEISIDESKMVENNIDEYEVRIYNGMNIMVSQIRTRKPALRINTRQFINGIYTVHFITGDKLQVEQLVISH